MPLLSFNVWPVAVDPMLLLRGREAEAPHSWFRGTAVGSWPVDGVANASIGQPASLAVVQPIEPPGSVELAHFSHLCSRLLTGSLCLWQRHLVGGLQIEDCTWKRC